MLIIPKQNKIIVPMAIGTLLLLVAFLYSPIFKNLFTNWDEIYILNNPYLNNLSFGNLKSFFTTFYSGNYHPLTLISLAIDYKLGGIHPWSYQLTNFLLHLCNTLLVYVFVKLLLQKFSSPFINIWIIALITAVLFGIHTFHVESVAWISERKNVLYAFFFLLSLIAYLKYLNHKSYSIYILSLALFILSLLSKGMAVPLSLCIIVIDYFAGRNLLSRKVILEKIPYIVLSLIFGFIAIRAQHSIDAIRVENNFTWFDRIAVASYSFIQYLIKLCFPYHLSAFYPYPVKTGSFLPYQIYGSIGLIILLLFILWRFFRQNRAVLFGTLFFIANISIVIQFLPVGDAVMSDRYVYIASIGFFFIIGYSCNILLQKTAMYRYSVIALLILYCAFLSAKTYHRVSIWKDSLTLWSDAVKNYPENNDRAFQNLGILSYEMGNYPEALKYYNRVLQMHLQNNTAYSKAYVGMGQVKQAMKDMQGAMNAYNTSLSYYQSYEGYYDRAVLKMELGDLEGAEVDLDKASQIDPLRAEAYINRGVIFYQIGNFTEALQNFDQVLKIDPQNSNAYMGKGQIKQATNDMQGAMSEYNTALSFAQTYKGYINRAVLKIALKDYEGARTDLDYAAKIDSLKSEVYINRGLIDLNYGNPSSALQKFNKAVKVNANDFRSYLYRGYTRISLADYHGAITDLDVSIRLYSNADAYYYRGIAYIKMGRKTLGCADLKKSALMGNVVAAEEVRNSCK